MNMPVEGSTPPSGPARAETVASSATPSFSRGGSLIAWLPRALFIVTVLYGAVLFWIAPRPPLGDFAQHVGQVALLRDLLDHASPWKNIVHINLFTPYLIGYALALPLAYVMPVAAAVKLLMMLSYLGFVASCVGFRRHLNGDPRLDVLFVPGFFGVSFAWGLFTFLVAAPVGMLFMWLAHRFATTPSVRLGVGVFLAGTVMFFSHALVFLFACAVGVGFVLVKQRSLASKMRALAPFVPLGLLCIAYAIWSHTSSSLAGEVITAHDDFDWGWTNWKRVFSLPVLVWGPTKESAMFLPVVALMAAVPWLWRDRINPDRAAVVPFLVVAIVWLLAPSTAVGTVFLYQRFALFLLPAYALMFAVPKPSHAASTAASTPLLRSLRGPVLQFAIIAGCWIFLADQAVRLHRFVAENAALDQLLAKTEPGQRALNLVFDRGSDAYRTPGAYMHQAVWYQAEKHGFVDLNFAVFVAPIVRFRPEQFALQPSRLEESPQAFDWKMDHGRMYRYFFVHKEGPLPANFFANDECDVALVINSGAWSLYERRTCR
ncbi:hypothetical protein AWB79_04455 [Caballeronia hypogeia]|uniref:Glycosyltransferase RgtA/B/C/D-like domain-containing protein n=1 Tax=Caballeronia hypogeia TaxID=1777140 RepID=A0A158BZC0_9BURK|nr:hypothetical protein [Caballeronia hypogeia]SAK75413.1 hypothetical protein AWB79_04455 [Caballeronia hypogeia]